MPLLALVSRDCARCWRDPRRCAPEVRPQVRRRGAQPQREVRSRVRRLLSRYQLGQACSVGSCYCSHYLRCSVPPQALRLLRWLRDSVQPINSTKTLKIRIF